METKIHWPHDNTNNIVLNVKQALVHAMVPNLFVFIATQDPGVLEPLRHSYDSKYSDSVGDEY